MRVDDHDLILLDEVAISTPLRLDPYEGLRYRGKVNMSRDMRSDADVEVDVANSRGASTVNDRAADPSPLLVGKLDASTGPLPALSFLTLHRL